MRAAKVSSFLKHNPWLIGWAGDHAAELCSSGEAVQRLRLEWKKSQGHYPELSRVSLAMAGRPDIFNNTSRPCWVECQGTSRFLGTAATVYFIDARTRLRNTYRHSCHSYTLILCKVRRELKGCRMYRYLLFWASVFLSEFGGQAVTASLLDVYILYIGLHRLTSSDYLSWLWELLGVLSRSCTSS